MVFSSILFIFVFLPIVFTLYLFIPRAFKNFYLLFFSLIFYFWAEMCFGWVMLVSIIGNYFIVLLLDLGRSKTNYKKYILVLGLLFNLGLLFSFKYMNFFAYHFSVLGVMFGASPFIFEYIPLAVGISFYTFHAISYLVDVYKGVPVQRNFIASSLYITFFPQLIAGPIIRYHTIAKELVDRNVNLDLIADGFSRFVIGLAKKILIANNLAIVSDGIFATDPISMSIGIAWLGIICFSLQIYFDFSGYSDMAIGLAKLFGFHFPENFNYPYISQSVTEFWRRWHISLSSWFRDYVYIPLGGNRVGALRTYVNLLIVFLLCGFWHGASWNFILWGLWFGLFLVLERSFGLRVLNYIWRPYRHFYLLIVVALGWVLFKSPDLSYVGNYLKALAGLSEYISHGSYIFELGYKFWMVFILALLFSFIPMNIFSLNLKSEYKTSIYYSMIVVLFVLSAMSLTVQSYNPFIYFRF